MKKSFAPMAALTVWAFAFAQIASAALTNRYVIKDNAGSAVPYDSQVNAASNIQIAIDYAKAGETVLVYAATYDAGGITNWPAGSLLTNRVVINKAITVRSLNNDPVNTIIKGAWDPAKNGPAAVRCVYMAAGSTLVGFTLTNGATLKTPESDRYGGGVWANVTPKAVISNCVIVGNAADRWGAGAYFGIYYNCAMIGNSAGNAGGGAQGSTLYNCLIASNSGCGIYVCSTYNCLIVGNNNSGWNGGGVYNTGGGCTQYNSTIVGNSAGNEGGGVYAGDTLYNCIIYSNSCAVAPNYSTNAKPTLKYCCTTPTNSAWVAGDGNITNNPMFVANGRGYGTNHVAGNYRLSGSSLCVNAGTNGVWTTNSTGWVDLDGRPRVRYGRVDIGCYEYVSKGTMFSVR